MKRFILLFLIFVILVFGFVLFGRKRNFQSGDIVGRPTPGGQRFQTIQSQTLKFNLQAPGEFQVIEKGTRVILSSSEGEVVVNRIGTNFDNLEEYLANLDSKHDTQILEEQSLSISNYEAVKRTVEYPTEPVSIETHYKIYTDNWVYTISTTFEPLYSDLDQIAQSFRYTP